jgi:hypothetical protein
MGTIEKPLVTSEVIKTLNYINTFMKDRMDMQTNAAKDLDVGKATSLQELTAGIMMVGRADGYIKATQDILELSRAMLEQSLGITPPQ